MSIIFAHSTFTDMVGAFCMFPNSWHIYDNLGELYLAIGDLTSAKEYFSKSLNLNPANQRTKNTLKKLK